MFGRKRRRHVAAPTRDQEQVVVPSSEETLPNLHLSPEIVAQWPEELRPTDDLDKHEFAASVDPILGPMLIHELGENRVFTVALYIGSAGIHLKDGSEVLPIYEFSPEALQSLETQAEKLIAV